MYIYIYSYLYIIFIILRSQCFILATFNVQVKSYIVRSIQGSNIPLFEKSYHPKKDNFVEFTKKRVEFKHYN